MQRTLVPGKKYGLYPFDHDAGTAKLGFVVVVVFFNLFVFEAFLFDILKSFST